MSLIPNLLNRQIVTHLLLHKGVFNNVHGLISKNIYLLLNLTYHEDLNH